MRDGQDLVAGEHSARAQLFESHLLWRLDADFGKQPSTHWFVGPNTHIS